MYLLGMKGRCRSTQDKPFKPTKEVRGLRNEEQN